MTTTSSDPRWRKSLELFNRGEYFESHEVLEGLWLETKGDPHNDLYKGVIQAAAAVYQLKRGIHSGAVELCRTSVKYLEGYAPEALGLDVAGLVAGMEALFEKGLETAWDAKRVPKLKFR